MKDVATLAEENQRLREQIADMQVKNALLQERVKQLLNQRYATSSEKVSTDQLGLFNEAEEVVAQEEANHPAEVTTVKSHQRQARPRVSIPAELPREEIVYDLPESDKVCPKDGTVLKLAGGDDMLFTTRTSVL